jgi:hypothetical protein
MKPRHFVFERWTFLFSLIYEVRRLSLARSPESHHYQKNARFMATSCHCPAPRLAHSGRRAISTGRGIAGPERTIAAVTDGGAEDALDRAMSAGEVM